MVIPTPDHRQRTLLAEALQLARYVQNTDAEPALRDHWQHRLRDIRDALRAYAHPIQSPLHPLAMDTAIDAVPLLVRRAFVEAALLVTRYHQVGGLAWQGSLPSLTLSRYSPDPVPDRWLNKPVIAQLCQAFALPDADPQTLQDRLAGVDQMIARQRRLIQAILTDISHNDINQQPHDLTPAAIVTLCHRLFGQVPIPPAAINWVHTDMQVFICLDYDSEQLADQSLWQALGENDRAQLQAFLRSLGQSSFDKFGRFPIFGPCSQQHLDLAWCDRLAQSTGLSRAEVIESLTRSISILPTQKAEAFLIHDIWGHHWQLMMTQFGSDYTSLATCAQPLRAAETAYTPLGPLTCREVFVVQDDQVLVNEYRARQFFHGEVQQRMGLLFTHLLGEMVADVAEFKFIWDNPQAADRLPSSSLFKQEPTKLDLSLADVDHLFLRVLQPLLEVQLSVLQDCCLEQDLLTEWALAGHDVRSLELRTSLKQAIARLYQIFFQEYNHTYLPTMTGNIGTFTQVVSNLLYLGNVVNALYTHPASQHQTLPFQDLLIIFIGCYCSSNSYEEFWAIDDVLAAYFLPCWQQLSCLDDSK